MTAREPPYKDAPPGKRPASTGANVLNPRALRRYWQQLRFRSAGTFRLDAAAVKQSAAFPKADLREWQQPVVSDLLIGW